MNTEIDEARLSELAEIANLAHQRVLAAQEKVLAAGLTALKHAIHAGDALNAAAFLLPHGQLEKWITTNFVGSGRSARVYRRVAFYQDLVLSENAETIQDALGLLAYAPSVRSQSHRNHEEISRLRRSGMTVTDVGALMEISPARVSELARDDWRRREQLKHRKRQREMKDARQALNRQRQAAAARQIGGQAATAYSFIRRAAQALQEASEREADRDARTALNDALARLYEAEENVVKAIATTKQETRHAA